MREPWHVRPDDTREMWCFLLLQTAAHNGATRITAWQLGVGNPAQLVYTDEMDGESPQEEDEVVAALLSRLDEHRYEQRFLHTPTRQTVTLLRTRLLASPAVEEPSLRGLSHVPLGNLLERYFAEPAPLPQPARWLTEPALPSDRQLEAEEDVIELFWRARKSVEPLVPAGELEGEPL
jgi:hypothetical protein